CDRWPTTARMCSAYGRDASMRCCVRRSFEAATISIAFVIFCVLFTLLIFVRISLPTAIRFFPRPVVPRRGSRRGTRYVPFRERREYVPVGSVGDVLSPTDPERVLANPPPGRMRLRVCPAVLRSLSTRRRASSLRA